MFPAPNGFIYQTCLSTWQRCHLAFRVKDHSESTGVLNTMGNVVMGRCAGKATYLPSPNKVRLQFVQSGKGYGKALKQLSAQNTFTHNYPLLCLIAPPKKILTSQKQTLTWHCAWHRHAWIRICHEHQQNSETW